MLLRSCVSAFAHAILQFDAMPTTFVYMSFFFVLSKCMCTIKSAQITDANASPPTSTVYSNSLLATLNTRKSVRGRGTDRGTGNNGDFTIIQTASNAHVRTTHSIFGQVDWTKQPTDLEVNVLKEIVSDRGFNDVRFSLTPNFLGLYGTIQFY